MTIILIVEDDFTIALLYEKILETMGIQTISANNGKEAVDLYISLSDKPDIILMDHRMPIKNGIEALKEILEIDNQSKIIFLSADSSLENDVLSIGAKKFIKKPFSIKELIKSIKKILNFSGCTNIV
jgi:DNA-binding response OmpR family regulator